MTWPASQSAAAKPFHRPWCRPNRREGHEPTITAPTSRSLPFALGENATYETTSSGVDQGGRACRIVDPSPVDGDAPVSLSAAGSECRSARDQAGRLAYLRNLAREYAAAGLPLRPAGYKYSYQRARGRATDRQGVPAPPHRVGSWLDKSPPRK